MIIRGVLRFPSGFGRGSLNRPNVGYYGAATNLLIRGGKLADSQGNEIKTIPLIQVIQELKEKENGN